MTDKLRKQNEGSLSSPRQTADVSSILLCVAGLCVALIVLHCVFFDVRAGF